MAMTISTDTATTNNTASANTNIKWKKLELSTSADQILMLQNSSVVPNSVVHICFTKASIPNNASFVLTGPNTWNGRVKLGTNVFYAEENGGIMTHSSYDIEPLVNYDIPPVHENIENARSQVLDIPEGAYFVIQNKSEKPFYFSIVGEGTFVIVEHQMLSFSFTRDTQVKFRGDGQTITYFYAEAPSLTQLSKKTKEMLEDMKAAIELLKEQMVTRPELYAVNKRTHHNKYNLPVALSPIEDMYSSNNVFSITGPTFTIDPDYDSFMPKSGEIVDMVVDISYNHNNATKLATIGVSFDLDDINSVRTPISYFCDDVVVHKLLKEIRYEYNRTTNTIRPSIDFNTWFSEPSETYDTHPEIFAPPYSLKFKIKSREAVWKSTSDAFNRESVVKVIFDNYPNKHIDFMTDKRYKFLVDKFKLINNIPVKRLSFPDTYAINALGTDFTITGATGNVVVNLYAPNNESARLTVDVKDATLTEAHKLVNIMFCNLNNINKSVNINVSISSGYNEDRIPRIENGIAKYDIDLYCPTMFGSDFYKAKFAMIANAMATDKYVVQITTSGGVV